MIAALVAFGATSPLLLALAGGLLALAESAVGVGFLLPGEAGIVGLSGVADGVGGRTALFAAVAAGAVAGDHVGYAVGRRLGPRMATWKPVRRLGPERWERAMALVERRGTAAVFASRLLPVVRTVVPATAGAAGLAYPRFLLGSVAGVLVWAGLWVGLGSAGAGLIGFL